MRYDEEHDRPDIDRALLRRVWSYGRPYLSSLIWILGTIFVISGLGVVPPILMGLLVDEAIVNKDIRQLSLLGLAMILVPLISAAVGIAQRWWSSRVGEGIIFDLRRELFAHLQRMSLRFFTATKTGELMNRLNSDVEGSQSAITGTLMTIISNLVSVIFILVVMLKLDWRLTLLAVAALPLFVIPARRVAKVLRRMTQQLMEQEAKMSGTLQESFNVSGALLVRLFGRWDEMAQRFGEQAAQVRDLEVRRAMVGRGFFAALGLVAAVGTATVFWVGGYLVIQGDLKVGAIVTFSALLVQLYGPLAGISNSRVEFATSLVSFERVFEVMDLEVDIPDPEEAEPLVPAEGRVELRDVSFRYQSDGPEGLEAVKRFWDRDPGVAPPVASASTREWAIKNASFVSEPGTLTALVGPSGAGKTTISYLVPRLYDVTEGAVLIDGHDVRNVALRELASSVGVVTQETYLFHDTIAANLRYAKPTAELDELVAACQAANIHEMISKLPLAYETVVGERGYRLSGGEKQRIAIARVLLEDPRILILDEATSHLDSRSEALIQEALEVVMEGRTSIVIAHRLSTVRAAHQILVLDDGQIVERGDHATLVAQDGLYASLYRTQFAGVGIGLNHAPRIRLSIRSC